MRLFSFFIIVALIPFNAFAFTEKLDSILSQKKPHEFHGITVIAKGYDVIYKNSTTDEIDVDTSSKIGSISKQITAVLAMQLQEQDKLNVHKPISTYLPNLDYSWKNKVTTHHLLTHTSGITDLEHPLAFEPGLAFEYSNTNYELVAKIIESITKAKYAHLVDGLFESARMNNSFAPSVNIARHYAQGYMQNKDGSIKKLDKKSTVEPEPSSGLVSSAKDLIRWNQLLHKKKLLLYDYAYDAFSTKHVKGSYRYDDLSYGYGIQVAETKKGTEYGHQGFINGYLATCLYYPADDMSVIVLENVGWYVDKNHSVSDAFYFHDKLRNYIVFNQIG